MALDERKGIFVKMDFVEVCKLHQSLYPKESKAFHSLFKNISKDV
jgi:hypothetical protein